MRGAGRFRGGGGEAGGAGGSGGHARGEVKAPPCRHSVSPAYCKLQRSGPPVVAHGHLTGVVYRRARAQQATYEHEKVPQWTSDVIEGVMKKLTGLQKPFKYIGE